MAIKNIIKNMNKIICRLLISILVIYKVLVWINSRRNANPMNPEGNLFDVVTLTTVQNENTIYSSKYQKAKNLLKSPQLTISIKLITIFFKPTAVFYISRSRWCPRGLMLSTSRDTCQVDKINQNDTSKLVIHQTTYPRETVCGTCSY